MQEKLDVKTIAGLIADGYFLLTVSGQGDERFAWMSSSGAHQRDTNQPPRCSADQAWYDCNEYAGDGDPGPARPDWLKP